MGFENISVSGYLALILAGFIASFVPHNRETRLWIRLITAALATPALVIVGMFFLGWLLLFSNEREPPTVTELTHDYLSRRADLETILRMSDEDRQFSRIAPTFVDPDPAGNTPNAKLPEPRWAEYQRIYRRTDINLGVQRDKAQDVFIIVDSIGLLNRGHASGYVHCTSDQSTDANRFHPCQLHQDIGKASYDPQRSIEGYSFQKIDERWFAYDEGPS